jgi:hypothetical protein
VWRNVRADGSAFWAVLSHREALTVLGDPQTFRSEHGMRLDADDRLPYDIPADYNWLTLGQITDLLRHGHYVNVQARTLVTCLKAMS